MLLPYIVLYVDDMELALSFYSGILGLDVGIDQGEWVEFDTEPARLILHQSVDFVTTGAGLFFQVESVDDMYERLLAMDVEVMEPEEQDLGFRSIMLMDPFGNVVEIGESMN